MTAPQPKRTKRSSSARDRKRRIARLFDLQGGCCAHCGAAMRLGGEQYDPEAPTLDHVIPRSAGGPDAMSNLVVAHRRCNEARGAGRLPKRAVAVLFSNRQALRQLMAEQ